MTSWTGLRTGSGSSRGRYTLATLSVVSFQLAPRCTVRQESQPRDATGLKADPAPFCVQAPAHAGLGTGVLFAVLLVAGAIALVAYSHVRRNRRTTGFQRFEVRVRKNGNMVMGSPLQSRPWLWATSADWLLPRAHPADGCLAHTSCLQEGGSLPLTAAAVAALSPCPWLRPVW